PDPPYEVQETAALPRPDLDRIRNFARFWELIVNRGAFDDLLPALLPPGKPAFRRFLALSDRLLERFGRNWGIDRRELRASLEAGIGGEKRGDRPFPMAGSDPDVRIPIPGSDPTS
ncbi:MAG: hypothetical protein LBG08_02660, partial [Spirochaetaceae bacterium]|nr:hypothetical protein [Spirochaetaceae bacterium]